MTQVTVQPTASATSNGEVTESHFGSNFLFHPDGEQRRDIAAQGSNYDIITDIVNAQTLRFPGGTVTEHDFDPTDKDHLAALEEFLAYCGGNGHKAVIVLRTEVYYSASSTNYIDPAAKEEVQKYVRDVLDLAAANGVTVQGFETGNEFYQNLGTGEGEWTAEEFGHLQTQMAEWVHDEIGESADIYIQSGRTVGENEDLVKAYNDVEPVGVDGIIAHIYYGATGGDLSRIGGVKNRLELLNDIWGSFDLDTIVTEWNTSEAGNYGGNNAVYGLARLAALTRGFGDLIGNGVDSAMIWSTIAPGDNGRATLGQTDGNGDLYMLPTGYWYQLLATTLIDTELVSDFGLGAAFYDATSKNEFAGYSYIFQGTGSESNDYHVLYASGVDDTLEINVNLSDLTSSGSYVYASVISNAGTTQAHDPHAAAQLEFLTDLNDVEDFTLEAYEFLQINVVTGHGVTFDTDFFNDVVDDLELTQYGDVVRTFGGNDTVRGHGGNDELILGSGDDLAYGGSGNDILMGEGGNDTLRGDDGEDTLFGGEGSDVLKGIKGNDVLYGGDQGDKLWGGKGEDVLYGEGGWDRLYGEDGNDTLNGGRGNDRLYGGDGADVFVFEDNFGKDKVYDFDSAAGDLIDLSSLSGINGFGDLNISQVGGAAQITIGGSYFKLIQTDVGDLTADDFIF